MENSNGFSCFFLKNPHNPKLYKSSRTRTEKFFHKILCNLIDKIQNFDYPKCEIRVSRQAVERRFAPEHLVLADF